MVALLILLILSTSNSLSTTLRPNSVRFMNSRQSLRPLFSSNQSLGQMVTSHSTNINKLQVVAPPPPPSTQTQIQFDDIFYMRFVHQYTNNNNVFDLEKAQSAITATFEYRAAQAPMLAVARKAVELAYQNDVFNNDPILSMAPHSSIVTKFITPRNSIMARLPLPSNDLLYIVKAGNVDDKELMKSVSVDQLTEFYTYAKEVQFLLSDRCSRTSDTLQSVVTLNDLSGTNLLGSSDFRNVLSKVSKQTSIYYPLLSRATVLANLPRLLTALAKIFTPLFPPNIQRKLKFVYLDIPELKNIHSSLFLDNFEQDILQT